MGEELTLFRLDFNRSIRIEARPERLTAEPGAILLREVMERLGISRWIAQWLCDPRDPKLITHPMEELLNTSVLMLAQGWRDHDDADSLRDDPALRLAVSTRRGISPLEMRPRIEGQRLDKNPLVPDGLASQPTLSRFLSLVGEPVNCGVLRAGLLKVATQRIRAMNHGRRLKRLTIDIDSLPVEVEGHQPGSEHNGHYHARIYHPLMALAAETGDLLDVQLRSGHVHTANGSLGFVESLIERVEKAICEKAAVRVDAGFPEENFLSGLERRETPYLARVKNNAVLDRMAAPHLVQPPPRVPGEEPRAWYYEKSYQAKSWSRARRVVLVVLEQPDQLFLHHFWIVTSWTMDEIDADDLLAHYRQRGTAEGYMGELMDVLAPALSSSPRPKKHYREHAIEESNSTISAFGHNEARLILNALAYNLMHTLRVLMESATGLGWSLRRLRERILKTPARILLHGRRAVVVIGQSAAHLWQSLATELAQLRLAES